MINKTPAILAVIVIAAIAILVIARPPANNTTTGAAASNMLSVQAPSSASAGALVTVSVIATDVRAGLYGVDLGLSYDPALFDFVSVSEGTFLSRSGADSTLSFADSVDTKTSGLVNQFIVLKVAGEGTTGSGTLATYTFRAKGSGSGAFAIANLQAANKDAQPVSLGTSPTSVTVR